METRRFGISGGVLGHDFERQRSETAWVLDDLAAKSDLPPVADFDFFLIPGARAQPADALIRALHAAGYAAVTNEDAGDVTVPVHGVTVSLNAIWAHERPITEIGLSLGYRPDGWGFMDATGVNEM